MHLHGLVLWTSFLVATPRRNFRVDDSKVTAVTRESYLPGGFGRAFPRQVVQANIFNSAHKQVSQTHNSHGQPPSTWPQGLRTWRSFGPRRATSALRDRGPDAQPYDEPRAKQAAMGKPSAMWSQPSLAPKFSKGDRGKLPRVLGIPSCLFRRLWDICGNASPAIVGVHALNPIRGICGDASPPIVVMLLLSGRRGSSKMLGIRRAWTVCSASANKSVVFLGTPDVASRSLELLLAASREGHGGGFYISAVVSQPPAPVGRKKVLTPSPVHELAQAEGLQLLTPPNAKDEGFLNTLAELKPDLCITAAYGCFLPQRFLDIPKFGTLNIHPSLLPLYRGAAPMQRCLEAGDEITGVTVAFTVLAMDAGPIVRQVERPLSGEETAPDLLLELFETGTAELVDALPSVWDGSYEATPQDGERATKAPKVHAGEAEVSLDLLSARAAHNRARGFAGWPGIWTMLSLGDGKPPVRAKLLSTGVGDTHAAPGSREVSFTGDALQFICADGTVLLVRALQLPGKKPCDAKSFWNGMNGREVRWVGSDERQAAQT